VWQTLIDVQLLLQLTLVIKSGGKIV